MANPTKLHETKFLLTHVRRMKKMALEFDQPETLESGGQFVDKPGTYHAVVTAVDETPASNDGKPLDALKVTLAILAGTEPGQKDKTFDLTLWHPTADDKSDMSRKKLSRFALAASLMVGHVPGQRASIEPSQAVARQLVLKLAWRQKKNEATGKWEDTDRVDLSFADIWHVDDPAVKQNSIPLDPEALKLIPAEFRLAQPASKPAPAKAATAAAASPVNLADI